ncbi:tetratricopeptide repeat protein 29 isoform X3 [Anolis carolinensis]|uniref:tetratricopeptide repeat protein 29 isoform X3 n=1 Tax=Anolis carolinensis TaxID=28377 RepID=UPI000462A1D1|nr:PREDICTED: tetratricopeptide repeat protein 29 isoform X2 [Anolis carolinensis]|eukprot:XP_008110222.1 PREDICTED: tetratricopeptide repeat protein 29 isoform X2 [Anolis carolinensis]
MSIFPPVPKRSPKAHPSMEDIKCPSPNLARMHLIKGKDAIDRYLAMHIKGLSKQEAAAYRNSYMKNTCIDMLRQGYHKSFAELFTLIENWNALREASGPGSAIWLEKSIGDQPDKLDQLHFFLIRAEAAQRSDQFLKAIEHYEAFHHLTVGRMWKDDTGRTFNSLACEHLWRIYTLLADKMLRSKEHKQAIKILIKALEMAKEVGSKKMEGEAAYCLALVYHSAGEESMAIFHLNTYLEISRLLEDYTGMGRAYQALAEVLVSLGEVSTAITYLKKFMNIAKRLPLSQSLVDVCTFLGRIYNARGDYDKACEYFDQAFAGANAIKNFALLNETKVYCGIGRAHSLMLKVNSHTEAANQVNIKYLLAWKENRSDMCSDPFTVDAKYGESIEYVSTPVPKDTT